MRESIMNAAEQYGHTQETFSIKRVDSLDWEEAIETLEWFSARDDVLFQFFEGIDDLLYSPFELAQMKVDECEYLLSLAKTALEKERIKIPPGA
jgi:hypothetical protein